MTNNIITRDYNGQTFSFREDGYFNMTKAAKVYGKDLSNFMRSPDTVDYVDALSQTVKSTDCPVVQAVRGGRAPGTWGHPKLAVFFARWLDVKFAVFCDMVIDDILNKKAELTITKPEESASFALPQTYLASLEELVKSLKEREQLEQANLQLTQEVTTLTPKAIGYDTLVSNDGFFTATQAAEALGMPSAIALNRFLRAIGWKSKRDTDAPTAMARDKGWLVTRFRNKAGTGRSFPQVFVTPKGLTELRFILSKEAA
ncbi:KilA-N domain-containing protein [uncultured Pseudomonas sp.]|uniref:KilA-N domain-containing protein n=1 Tax=uncultured Pseudomonas sp. TaxID=114707 RepID=UPI00262F47E6|nr:KilA-N domain-containing protein [uncultured Pseudomonas sp.]